MIPKVMGTIRETNKDKRRKQGDELDARPERVFHICSPLLGFKPKKGEASEFPMEALHPFWSVLQCAGSKPLPNMTMELEPLVVPHLHFTSEKKNNLRECGRDSCAP